MTVKSRHKNIKWQLTLASSLVCRFLVQLPCSGTRPLTLHKIRFIITFFFSMQGCSELLGVPRTHYMYSLSLTEPLMNEKIILFDRQINQAVGHWWLPVVSKQVTAKHYTQFQMHSFDASTIRLQLFHIFAKFSMRIERSYCVGWSVSIHLSLTSKCYSKSPFKNESLTQAWPTGFALITAFLLGITDNNTHIKGRFKNYWSVFIVDNMLVTLKNIF